MSEPAITHETTQLSAKDCNLADFAKVVSQQTDAGAYPHAVDVDNGVVVFDSDELRSDLTDPGRRPALQTEIAGVLLNGPGIAVFKNAVDVEAVEHASEAFQQIIAEEKQAGGPSGDHFAKPGANDRVWNALEKLALRDPKVFYNYYRNDMLALVSGAWLGPGYQVTSQINVVNPGGEGQQPHRDYHLGFMTDDQAMSYPSHIHRLSPVLTLQGAIAHCDMPVETGPTKYLPHSQKYEAGYLAWRRPEFIQYFAEHHVQLPLGIGDAIFFNPAVFHGAGTNRTSEVRRMANLLQISSAMGRAMEKVDRMAMSRALFPVLLAEAQRGAPAEGIDRVIAAAAEGYAFPANLDVDQPVGGLAPASMADIVTDAVSERWSQEELADALSKRYES